MQLFCLFLQIPSLMIIAFFSICAASQLSNRCLCWGNTDIKWILLSRSFQCSSNASSPVGLLQPIQSFEYLSKHISGTVRGGVLVSVAWGHRLVCWWQLMDRGCGTTITEKHCRMLHVKTSNHVIGLLGGHPVLWAPKMTWFQLGNDVIFSSWHANVQLNKMSRLI